MMAHNGSQVLGAPTDCIRNRLRRLPVPLRQQGSDEMEELDGEHLIAHSLFGARAVRQYLSGGLSGQGPQGTALPLRCKRQLGEHDRDGGETSHFTNQVVVGGTETGSIPPASPRAVGKDANDAPIALDGELRRVAKPLKGDGDRDRANSCLERAAPFDAVARGIMFDPGIELLECSCTVTTIAREKPGLGEPGQML